MWPKHYLVWEPPQLYVWGEVVKGRVGGDVGGDGWWRPLLHVLQLSPLRVLVVEGAEAVLHCLHCHLQRAYVDDAACSPSPQMSFHSQDKHVGDLLSATAYEKQDVLYT